MNIKIITCFFFVVMSSSCKRQFVEIQYGKEACGFCKMMIVDSRYAAEMVDEKGKVFKFDDIACMKHYITQNNLADAKAMLFVANFSKGNNPMIDARSAIYLHHEYFKSPMHGNYGAFSSQQDAKHLRDSLGVAIVTWEKLQ